MLKIRTINARDRIEIYKLVQQEDWFTPTEIEVMFDRIDTFLFESDQKKYCVIIMEDQKKNIQGYAVYGSEPETDRAYKIYRIVPPPLAKNNNILRTLLKFIEKDIQNKQGRIIFIELSSNLRYHSLYEFYTSNHYELTSKVKNYFAPGEDKLILTKNLNNLQ
jgi:hypothetical protein